MSNKSKTSKKRSGSSGDSENAALLEESQETEQVDDKDTSRHLKTDTPGADEGSSVGNDPTDEAATVSGATAKKTFRPSSWLGTRFFRLGDTDKVSSITRDVPRYKISDQREKQTFILVLIAGVVFVFFTKYLDLLPTWLITFTSMVLVGGYAFFAYTMRNDGIRVDRAGDNAYYLGLVYTLCSMSVVLIRGEFGSGAAEQILSGFGVALGSTIAGIVSRIILIQFREGVEDLERSAMVVLKNTVQDLEHALISSVERATAFSRALEDHSVAIRETFSESFKTIENTSYNNVKELSAAHAEAQQKLAEETKEILRSARDSMAEAASHMTETSETIRDGARTEREEFGRFLQAISNFSKNLENVQIPTDIIKEFIRSLEEQRDHTRRIISETDTLYTNLNDKSANLNRRLEDITGDIQNLARSIKEEHASVSDVTNSLAAMAEGVRQSSGHIKASSKSLNDGIDEFKKNSRVYVSTLAETANFLADEIGRSQK